MNRADGRKPDVLHIVCERDVGLFNLILGMIPHVHWALREGRIPIAFLGQYTCYWTPSGYRGRDSVWEYYFEPLVPAYPASRIPSPIRHWIANNPQWEGIKGQFVDESTFVSRDGARHVKIEGEPIRGPEHGVARKGTRRLASGIVRDFFRPRPYILEKADQFARRHMNGRFVIGAHIRGTDAIDLPGRFSRRPDAHFRICCAALRRQLRINPDALILVATDTQDTLDRMRDVFGDRVISYDSIRHQDGEVTGKGPLGKSMPAFLTQDRDVAARSGEDAVVEYLLLCRCAYLVHNLSAMARAVLLTVPEMPETSVDVPTFLQKTTAAIRRKADTSMARPFVWLRWGNSAREAISGKPARTWVRVLRELWIERRDLRFKRSLSR